MRIQENTSSERCHRSVLIFTFSHCDSELLSIFRATRVERVAHVRLGTSSGEAQRAMQLAAGGRLRDLLAELAQSRRGGVLVTKFNADRNARV